jgi:acyl-CoA reductase-like NAD-dependent aldehyde dehydrogenase
MAPEGIVVSRLAINCYAHIDLIGKLFLGGRGKSRFKRQKNKLALDVFLASKCIGQH